MQQYRNLLLKKLHVSLKVTEPNVSRRDFLHNSAKLGLGLTAAIMPRFIYASGIKPRVAIIGAGIAGLNAANYLQDAGVITKIYEADSRPGGRISSNIGGIVPGLTTEIGGEFIDSSHTEMLRLMASFGLKSKDVASDPLYYQENKETYFVNNRRFSAEEVTNAFAHLSGKINSDFNSLGKNVNSPAAVRLDNQSLEEYLAKAECENWLKQLLATAYTSEYGLDPGEQSSLNLVTMLNAQDSDFKMYGESDEIISIDGGNEQLIKALTSKLKGQIEYGKKLTEIRPIGARSYSLSFDDKEEAVADYVIITVPFSVLRQISMNKVIRPGSKKHKAIHTLGYGTNSKFIAGFNSRIWREKYQATGYSFNELINNGWDSSRLQASDKGAGIYTMLIGGQHGQLLADHKNDKTRSSNTFLKQLDRIYPGSLKEFNGKMMVADWPNRAFAKGSYSCYKTSQWTSIRGEESITVGKIYFAGEHCSNEFQGYMNGGAETGKQAALSVLEDLGSSR
jgi:monoamine oxidase